MVLENRLRDPFTFIIVNLPETVVQDNMQFWWKMSKVLDEVENCFVEESARKIRTIFKLVHVYVEVDAPIFFIPARCYNTSMHMGF